MMNKIKEIAVEAAREAGLYALGRMGNIEEVQYKRNHNDIVTDVDKHCEKLIIGRIQEEFPAHGILAEESGETAAEAGDFLWIIDPIDGTTNYAHGFPFFCVSIGVMCEGEMKMGVVYDPTRDELFTAEAGKGAFLNGKKIRVSSASKVMDSIIGTGFSYDPKRRSEVLPYFENVIKHAQAIRRAGSAALDLSYVACGRFDGFWEFGLNPWDISAGLLLIQEAGGKISKMSGGPSSIHDKEIVASNGNIHQELLNILTSWC